MTSAAIWHDTAEQIASAFAHGRGTTGLVDGIAALARASSTPFPYESTDLDELSDQPVFGGSP